MYRPCYAPVFEPSEALHCFGALLRGAFILLVLIILLILTFGSEGIQCLIRQTTFRIRHCRDGNDDPRLDIGFSIERWIRETPEIQNAIIWRPDGDTSLTYADWTREDKALLESLYERLRDGGDAGLDVAPVPSDFTYHDEGRGERGNELAEVSYPVEVAKTTFFAHVAQSLLVEIEGRVPWSPTDLSDEHRAYLLDSQHMYYWSRGLGGHALSLFLGKATPGDPGRVYATMSSLGLPGADQRSTILALLEWCRSLFHDLAYGDSSGEPDVHPGSRDGNLAHWQYEGYQPVERTFGGTVRSRESTPQHWTNGCQGTTGFLRCVLRTVNIPVERLDACSHAIPHFLDDATFLSHGDDPYVEYMRSWTPQISMSEILLDDSRLAGFFDDCDHVGRGVSEAMVRLLPDQLIESRCRDLEGGVANADSEVFAVLSANFALEELESDGLWERLDAEIARRGGCGGLI